MTLKHLYFFLKWKEGLSPFQTGPPFLCFENGMFNTMKSLSPAPFLCNGLQTPARGSFHGKVRVCRNEDKGRQEAGSGMPGWRKRPAFSKPSQGTGAWAVMRQLFRGANINEIWRELLSKWALPHGHFSLMLYLNFYNIPFKCKIRKGVANLSKFKMYEYIT